MGRKKTIKKTDDVEITEVEDNDLTLNEVKAIEEEFGSSVFETKISDVTIEEAQESKSIEVEMTEEEKFPEIVEESVVNETPDLVEELFVAPIDTNWEAFLNAMAKYQSEFGVTKKRSIEHAQYILNIGQTGVLDERTRSAFNQCGNYADLINDYNNQRKK